MGSGGTIGTTGTTGEGGGVVSRGRKKKQRAAAVATTAYRGQPREPRSGKRGVACIITSTHLLLCEAQFGPLAQPALVL